MSLINQMLRDLEQRNNQPPKAAEQALDVRIAVKPAGGRTSRLWLLALTVLPLTYFWYQNQASRPPAPVAAGISKPQQVGTAAPTGPRDEPSPTPLPNSAPNAEVRPSEPPPTVAASAPNPSPAMSQKPVAAQFGDNEPVKLAEAFKAIASKQAVIPPSAERSKKPSQALPPTEKIKTAKASTSSEQAEELYRQAQRSVSALMIKENLKEALQLEPRHLPARTLLLQTLMKSHADAELGEFADESLALFPSNLLFIKTRAHLYVQHKNFAGAVNLLERIDADTVDDSTYLALLAASYQQLQRFPQAARIYQQLSQIQPDKAENWLGLAVAQDKLNQGQAAAQSYRQALDKKTLNAEVVSYIKQRLTALHSAL